jgi:hypothetical protein
VAVGPFAPSVWPVPSGSLWHAALRTPRRPLSQVEAQHSNLQHLNLQNSPGLGVLINTSAKTDAEAKLLLTAMRFPFRSAR